MMDYIYASGTTYVVPYLSPLIIALVTRASMCLSARPPFRIGMAWTVRRSPSIIGRRLPMADNAPLLFSPRLGGLFPVNAAAPKAMQAITGKVRVEHKQTRGNTRRMTLYWDTHSTGAAYLPKLQGRDQMAQTQPHNNMKHRPRHHRAI